MLINSKVQNPLYIPNAQADPLDVMPDIQNQRGQNIENDRETNRQERRVNKKQPDLACRNVEFFCEESTNAKALLLEIRDDLLVHVYFLKILTPIPQFKHFFLLQ